MLVRIGVTIPKKPCFSLMNVKDSAAGCNIDIFHRLMRETPWSYSVWMKIGSPEFLIVPQSHILWYFWAKPHTRQVKLWSPRRAPAQMIKRIGWWVLPGLSGCDLCDLPCSWWIFGFFWTWIFLIQFGTWKRMELFRYQWYQSGKSRFSIFFGLQMWDGEVLLLYTLAIDRTLLEEMRLWGKWWSDDPLESRVTVLR